MKRYILLLALLQIPFFLFSQGQKSIDLKGFTSIEVSGNIVVEMINSGNGALVFYDELDYENIEAEIEGGVLKIKGKTELGKEPALNLKLFLNEKLTSMQASKGGGIISMDTIHANALSLKAGSGGKMELHVALQSLDIDITQGSDIVLYGKTDSQNVRVSAWGNYLAYDLEAEDSYVKAASKSQAKIVARRIVNATSNGKSFIGYIGEPESTYVKTSLGGEVAAFKTKKIALDQD